MKKLLKILIVLSSILLNNSIIYSQEGNGGHGNSGTQTMPASCTVPSDLSQTNCNLIVYCYDASGNRVLRFAPNCGITPTGGGGGGLPMEAPPQTNTLVVYNMEVAYPNPTTGPAKIEFSNEIKDGIIRIVDVKGAVLYESTFNSKVVEFDLSIFNEGLYYIAIYSKDKNIVQPIQKTNQHENNK